MYHTFKVVLTQGDKDQLRHLEQSVRAEKQFEIVGATQNGREALRIICEKKPDIVILDAILPDLDGLHIVHQLAQNTTPLPIIFFLSPVYNETHVQEVINSGVYYYMAKPYSMDSLITQMCLVVCHHSPTKEAVPAVSTERRDAATVTFILRDIGVPANLRGYSYLRAAILYSLKHGKASDHVTKDLYPQIAAQFQTTSSCLERDMRHAITNAWKQRDPAVIQKYFGSSILNQKNCISNSKFIAILTDHIRAGKETAAQNKTEEQLS